MYKPAIKGVFNQVAGEKGYMTYADWLKQLKKKYGIKEWDYMQNMQLTSPSDWSSQF